MKLGERKRGGRDRSLAAGPVGAAPSIGAETPGKPGKNAIPGQTARRRVSAVARALDAASPQGGDTPALDLAPVVGANLRRLRVRRGLSLERLARACGVSRAMLGQIELGQSAPTVNSIWKIAHALEVPFSSLIGERSTPGVVVLRSAAGKRLHSDDGRFVSRALFPHDAPRAVELYELRLLPGCVENADTEAPGTRKNLVVAAGTAEIEIGGQRRRLLRGDSIWFDADQPHGYRNPAGAEAVLYLVIAYADPIP